MSFFISFIERLSKVVWLVKKRNIASEKPSIRSPLPKTFALSRQTPPSDSL